MRKILLLLCLVATPAWAADTDNTELRRALDAKCEEARAARLRPLQQQKIEECVREPAADREEKKTRAQCEAYWKDYGWGQVTGSGTRNPSYYEEIPECLAAFRARQAQGR